MVSEICNSLKEEKEDASSTNCVLEERDKIRDQLEDPYNKDKRVPHFFENYCYKNF